MYGESGYIIAAQKKKITMYKRMVEKLLKEHKLSEEEISFLKKEGFGIEG